MDVLNENGVSLDDEILRNADEAETQKAFEEDHTIEDQTDLMKTEKTEAEHQQTGGKQKPEETAENRTQNGAGQKAAAEKNGKPDGTAEKAAETEKAPETKKAAETEKAAEKPQEKSKKSQEEAQIEDLTDRLKRNLAEFDNFRKRTEKEKASMFDMGARDVLEKLLPVVDNFERSLASAPDIPECKAYTDGMQMIYRQLLDNLSKAGVTPIDCKGKPFDPNFHNAVMHVEDESLGENVVAEELQKGYLYKDAVLRHSMVKVAN